MSDTNFEVKDSGERREFNTGFKRDIQSSKPRFDLMVPKCIPWNKNMFYRLADHLRKGYEKYGYRNWEMASTKEELISFEDSMFRHFMQYIGGEIDEDHAAAIMFNIIAAEMVKYKLSQKGDTNESN